MHKQQGWPQAWECCEAKPIQTFGRDSQGVNWSWSQCIKSHHTQTSSGKGLPSHFWNRNIVRSVLPWLRRKITGLLLSGPLSLEEAWRVTESMFLEVHCEVSTVCDDLGCHVICWCWSTVFSEVHSQRSHLPGNFRALHASFCWQALWRCWFHFPAGLYTYPHCQRYQKLVQRENLWGIVKRKMRDTRPNSADDLKAAIKVTWASLHLSSATGWLPPSHAALMQKLMQKEAQPSIECIEMNILFRSLTFLFKIYIFIDLM